MAKEIKYGSEARTALEKGVNQLADDVYKRQVTFCVFSDIIFFFRRRERIWK